MLSRTEIEEIIADKESFSKFSSTAMIIAITKGLEHTKRDNTPLSSITSFLETLRKVRGDLTGDSQEHRIPQMMVNISFGSAPKAVALPIEGEVVHNDGQSAGPETIEGQPPDLGHFFGEGNIESDVSSSTES